MTARYQIRLYEPVAGGLVAIFDDFNSLYYYRRLDDVDSHTISINGADPRRDLFTLDSMIEVLRTDSVNGVPWGVEYGGFHRTSQDQTTDRADSLYTTFGRAYLDLLQRRSILWYAGSAGDTKSGPADNIIKAYVRENAGSLALVSGGRLRDGQTTGLSVAADASLGPTWSGSASWKDLLATVTLIAKTSLVDFSLVRTGALTFNFATFYPRIGTDRTGAGAAAPVVFAPGLGNMSRPFAVESHTSEVNDIIVLGAGADAARAFRERQDVPAQGASPWNRIEGTHDARILTTNAQLDAAGDQQLNALRTTRHITFEVLQTPGVVYGRDYFLGDLVLARYRGLQVTKKIVGVEVTVANGTEKVVIHMDDENAVTS